MDDGMGGLINRIKAMSGIYGMGFDRESMAGITIPVIIVIAIGTIGWVLIRTVL
jgi:hypothetical protein